MTNDRNLIMAIVLSVAILFGFQLFQDVFFSEAGGDAGRTGFDAAGNGNGAGDAGHSPS
jgi:hypothetical protein